jgi:hypothetical protein
MVKVDGWNDVLHPSGADEPRLNVLLAQPAASRLVTATL